MSIVDFSEVTLAKNVAILIKDSAMVEFQLRNGYLPTIHKAGIPEESVRVFAAPMGSNGKVTAKQAKEALETSLMSLMVDHSGATYIYAAESTYFKALTKSTKLDPHYGYILPCALKGYEHINVVLGVNHQALIYNPSLINKLEAGFEAIAAHALGTYKEPGSGIIESEAYPNTPEAIREALWAYIDEPELYVDIEGFSLRFNEAGIGTIGFSKDIHNGIAFACDYSPLPFVTADGSYGEYVPNPEIRSIIKEFLSEYKGKMWWHYAPYDLKAIIYTLWMEHILDYEGLLKGLHILLENSHDTRNIAYLAINHTSEYSLSLKDLAQEFAGNWANSEINDITKIPLNDLLRYNLVDCLSTCYVKERYLPIAIQDDQMGVYEDIFRPSMKLIIQMELVGMPLNDSGIGVVKKQLEDLRDKHEEAFRNTEYVKSAETFSRLDKWRTANAALKTKRHPLSKYDDVVFNPNSVIDMQSLLYEVMELPALDKTKTGQPAVGAKTLDKLINHCDPDDIESKDTLEGLIGFGKVDKILGTFIPAFENGILKEHGIRWLHGSFNLGGTVSGRLSSSGPGL